MNQPDLLAALTPVVDTLEAMEVPYEVVGSLASSAHGIPRSTLDADLVADLQASDVDVFVTALESAYYIDRDAARDAVRCRTLFNLVHLDTMLKVDVYVLSGRPFEREAFRRRRQGVLAREPDARLYYVAAPEDVVLHKLTWYRSGGEVSDRQWADIIGVLRLQTTTLDIDYMRRWAKELGVDDLLDRALREAGI